MWLNIFSCNFFGFLPFEFSISAHFYFAVDMLHSVTQELVQSRNKKQFYPFCSGELVRHMKEDRMVYLQRITTENLGLTSCVIDPNPVLSTTCSEFSDVDSPSSNEVNSGTLFVFVS